jgi:enamine deaminase RidA (YjgF/YER057c/UK114 family)
MGKGRPWRAIGTRLAPPTRRSGTLRRCQLRLKHACCVTTDAGSHFPPRLYRGVPYDYAAVAPPGTLLFTAGACPLDADGRVVAAGDHREQARVALANLLAVLSIHNCGPENLVRTTIYVVGERDDLARVWDAVAAGLAPSRPPSTLLGVVVLGYPDQLVEIAGVAAVA